MFGYAILMLSGLNRMANWRKSDLYGQNTEICRVIFFEKKNCRDFKSGGPLLNQKSSKSTHIGGK